MPLPSTHRDIRAMRATANEIITTTYTFDGSLYRTQTTVREKIIYSVFRRNPHFLCRWVIFSEALGIAVRGSAVPESVYIFTLQEAKPTLIWEFETGDRADGGLRNVYAENGHLVIELFGKDRVIAGQLYRGEEALCCPRTFTRARYKWTGSRFEETSREVLENPSGDANPLMPKHTRKA